jgi:hypothetical protein
MDRLVSQKLGLGSGYQLHMIHNVRPTLYLSGPPRWPALTITLGVLIASGALLIFVLGI